VPFCVPLLFLEAMPLHFLPPISNFFLLYVNLWLNWSLLVLNSFLVVFLQLLLPILSKTCKPCLLKVCPFKPEMFQKLKIYFTESRITFANMLILLYRISMFVFQDLKMKPSPFNIQVPYFELCKF